MRKTVIVCFLSAGLGVAIAGASHSFWHPDRNGVHARISDNPLVRATVAQNGDISGFADREPESAPPNQGQRAPAAIQVSLPDPDEPTDSPDSRDANSKGGAPLDSLGRELSAAYAPLVRPPSLPERLTTQELYTRFVNDKRDEAWAYPMELGINQFVARRGAHFGAAFDYVGCGSRYCMIAGAVYGGGQPAYNEIMAEMTQSGWWQASGGNHTTGYSTDTEYRFVSIFPRTLDDGLR